MYVKIDSKNGDIVEANKLPISKAKGYEIIDVDCGLDESNYTKFKFDIKNFDIMRKDNVFFDLKEIREYRETIFSKYQYLYPKYSEDKTKFAKYKKAIKNYLQEWRDLPNKIEAGVFTIDNFTKPIEPKKADFGL